MFKNLTLFSLIAELSAPRINLMDASLKGARPNIGRYS